MIVVSTINYRRFHFFMGFVDFLIFYLILKNKNKNTKTDATLTAQGER